MRKSLLFLSLVLCLAGYANPIMPIRMTADSMRIALTDYLPALYNDPTVPEEQDIINVSRSLMTFNVADKEGNTYAIPVLPNKPVMQGMMTVGYEKGILYIYAETKSKLRFQVYVENTLLPCKLIKKPHSIWELNVFALRHQLAAFPGRSYLRIFAEDDQYLYNDLLIPLQDGEVVTDAEQLNRHDQQAQVLYSVLIDRFYNGNTANDWKMNSPEVLDIVDYQGGDLAGITKKIEDGYFDNLGVNTLWISPITQNPWDAWGCYPFKNGNKYDPSKTYTKFSGYHGYWPIYATKLDDRFGTPDELRTLLSTAHAHGINVVLDYVANHMHINSPTLQAHPDWHTDSILPDGRRNFELWDEARLTTWFDKHIPTLDLERPEVCQAMTDSALYWLQEYELDGYRHDACKHIPLDYWRMLGQKIATRWPGRPIWMIGETYGSPELIGSYVKSGMLNAQFDFNVYFTAREALCGLTGMDEIIKNELTSLATYGSHHTMGNISGNHDQIRFASIAGGAIDIHSQGKEEGWTQEIGIGDADKAYKRALMLEVLNMTLPGVPCIYQGDEYAEVGANDPDNRHMMRFDNLNEQEKTMRDKISKLIALRRSSMPLLYGDFIPVTMTADKIVYERVYLGESVYVELDRKNLEVHIYIEEEEYQL